MSNNAINDNITPVVSENSVTYSNPKYNDFKVIKISLINNKLSTVKIENHSIIFVFSGKCLIQNSNNYPIQVNAYETYFIEKNTDLNIQNTTEDDSILFIATF
jgi:hypothetical protein